MKICIVGKFPPIEGGVSMHTFRYAHGLAQQGHQVHVVTNANEVRAPYRMFMREEDWALCDGDYGEGCVRVHWTDPFDREQWHIPSSNPFVSKLTSIGARVCAEHDIDVVFSFYLEPYGVAGHLIAQIAGVPHVVKTAGSDAGRLWQHPQFQPLYNHIFKSADFIVAASKVFENLRSMGVPPSRFRPDREFRVPEEVFTPDGPALDVELLCRQVEASPEHAPLQRGRMREGVPYIGVYGKLGQTKGTFALLRAMARLVGSGRDIGLLVMAHEPPRSPVRFCEAVSELSLEEHVVQLPFLPHWRVPEFIRRCVAVCCLEQDFPITIHTPITPREVLCCGGVMIGSTEMIRKLPQSDRLIDGYNCFAIKDVNDVDELSGGIARALDGQGEAEAIGRRARDYVLDIQKPMKFPGRIEQTLALAVSGQTPPGADRGRSPRREGFRLARMAVDALNDENAADLARPPAEAGDEMAWAEDVLADLTARVDAGAVSLATVRDAVKFNLCMERAARAQEAEDAAQQSNNRIFRLGLRNGAAYPDDIRFLVPSRLPQVFAYRFDCDVNAFLTALATGSLSTPPSARETYAVFLAQERGRGIRTIVLDSAAARLLALCDGSSAVCEISSVFQSSPAGNGLDETWVLETFKRFFEIGLVSLTDAQPAEAVA